MKKTAAYLRRAVFAAASDVGLYVLVSFFVTGLLIAAPYIWWREHIEALERFILVPWGMALVLLSLQRRAARGEKEPLYPDEIIHAVLLGWVVVPFAIRFGNTTNNSISWVSHAIILFGVYATIAGMDGAERERMLDRTALLFALCSVVLAGALLACAWTGRTYGEGDFIFGVSNGMYLCANSHYNMTGMVCMCCALMSLLGASRSKTQLERVLCLLGMVLMSAVVVLTQSRTARYVLILACAIGVYGHVSDRMHSPRRLVRHAAGILAAAMVCVCGYAGASVLTDAALAHYEHLAQGQKAALIASAAAEEAQKEEPEKAQKKTQEEKREGTQKAAEGAGQQPKLQARAAADASFSGRTGIWKNLLKRWQENPKYLVIGFGIGRIGSQVLEGTIHEDLDGVAIHNAYLQYAADFGLIGFFLLAAFMVWALRFAVRAFFAEGAAHQPGDRILCMLIAAIALTGMMESAPLNMMSSTNIMLFFALAVLAGRGRECAPCQQR